MIKKGCLSILVFLIGLLQGSAAIGVFLRFEDGAAPIEGDSNNPYYPGTEGWIKVNDYGFGIENTVNIGSISAGVGKATFQTIVITKDSGAGSADFFRKCATGVHYEKATLVVVEQDQTSSPKPVRILQADFYLVIVETVTLAGKNRDDTAGESVTFQHGAQRMEFFGKNKDGGEVSLGVSEWSRVLSSESTGVQ